MQATWMRAAARAAAMAAMLAVAAGAQAQTPEQNQAILMYKGADRDKRLLERARQEGTVSVYTSLAPTEAKPLVAAFEAKYPGVKVEMWRGQSEGVVQRVVSEARGKRHVVDVVETNGPEMESLAREQVLTEFYTPNFADIPADIIPKHRQWVPDRINFYVVAFNTRKVRAEDIPKSYEGFLDPKWKGRIAMEANDSEWMGSMVKTLGETRGMEFFRRLSDVKPELRKGHILLMQLVASGEVEVALAAYYANAASTKRRGGTVDWVPVEPVIAKPQGIGIARNAPHPHAALLFAEFMLSREAQTMLGEMGRGPSSRAVKSDTSSLKYVMSDPSVILDENDKWHQLWSKYFMAK